MVTEMIAAGHDPYNDTFVVQVEPCFGMSSCLLERGLFDRSRCCERMKSVLEERYMDLNIYYFMLT